MPVFLPLVTTVLVGRLFCQSGVTSQGGSSLRAVPTCSKRCFSGGLLWLIVLILCVRLGANTRGWVNRTQTDKHSRWRRGGMEGGRGIFDRERYRDPRERATGSVTDWIRKGKYRFWRWEWGWGVRQMQGDRQRMLWICQTLPLPAINKSECFHACLVLSST